MYFHFHICSVWPLYHIHMCIYLISTPQSLILNACFILQHLIVECYWIQLTDEFTFINEFKIIQPHGYVIWI